MKKVLRLLLVSLPVITSFAACTKGTLVLPQSAGTVKTAGPITGAWQFVAARGGIDGGYLYIPDIYTTYTFNADSTYTHIPDNKTGTFHIGQEKSIFDGKMHADITFSNIDYSGLITLKDDTLTISDNHTEPYIGIYRRLK